MWSKFIKYYHLLHPGSRWQQTLVDCWTSIHSLFLTNWTPIWMQLVMSLFQTPLWSGMAIWHSSGQGGAGTHPRERLPDAMKQKQYISVVFLPGIKEVTVAAASSDPKMVLRVEERQERSLILAGICEIPCQLWTAYLHASRYGKKINIVKPVFFIFP